MPFDLIVRRYHLLDLIVHHSHQDEQYQHLLILHCKLLECRSAARHVSEHRYSCLLRSLRFQQSYGCKAGT